MSRAVPANLQTHLETVAPTLAMCWKVVRRDSTVQGFTAHDANLVFDGVTYYARNSWTPSDMEHKAEVAVGNMEATGIYDPASIQIQDILSGALDYSDIEVFIVNWADLTQGRILLQKSVLGEVSSGDYGYSVEVLSLSAKLKAAVGQVISPLCRANLGDNRCTVDMTGRTLSATVLTVTDNRTFTVADTLTEGDYDGGKLTWTTGNNAGTVIEVKTTTDHLITLYDVLFYAIEPGDTFDMEEGCDKFSDTCRDRFNNLVNFRGEPFVPGPDLASRAPDSKT